MGVLCIFTTTKKSAILFILLYYIDENIGELYFSVMGFLHTIRDQQEDTARIETVAADIQDVVNRQTCRPCFTVFGM